MFFRKSNGPRSKSQVSAKSRNRRSSWLGRRHSLALEPLEDRRLLAVSTTFSGPTALFAALDVNASNQANTQSEIGVAVNPANPLNVVAVANNNANIQQLATYFTTDGGINWTASFITSAQDGFGAGESRFDPNVAFDSDGNVYVVYSLNGEGGANNSRLAVARSTDGGSTYTLATQVTNDATAGGAVLHTAMVTTRPDPAGADDVFVTVARVVGDEEIEAYLSLDAGATYTVTNGVLNDGAPERTFLPWAFADEFGNFHVVWEVDDGADGSNPEGRLLHDVLNGATLADGADTLVSNLQLTDFANANSKIPAQPNRGLFSVSTIDIDLSGGPFDGRIYVSYSDRVSPTSNDVDIFVRFSDNNGASWSAPIQVNDDGTLTSQFMPRMGVDQTSGDIYVAWYDARNDLVNNRAVNIFAAVSSDGGATWSPNVRVTQEESDVAVPGNNGNDYTEYLGLSVRESGAYISWTDKRASNFAANSEDVFVGYVARAGQTVTVEGDLDGTPTNDAILVQLDPSGTFLQTFINGVLVHSQALEAVESLIINGLGGNDTLTVDEVNGFVDVDIIYNGGTQAGVPGDSLRVNGNGNNHGTYLPSSITPGSGVVTVDGRTITFTGLEPVVVTGMFEFTFITPNSNDVITVDSPAAGQNRISGTSGNVAFESITFFDVDHFKIDTATNDAPLADSNDTVTFTANLVATDLDSFTVETGQGADSVNAALVTTIGLNLLGGEGNDSLTGGTANDFIDGGDGNDVLRDGGGGFLFGGGANTVIGGDGSDLLFVTGSSDVDGGQGDDILNVLTAAAGNFFMASDLFVVPKVIVSGPASAIVGDVEKINLRNTNAATTTYTINDLTGTSVRSVGVATTQNEGGSVTNQLLYNVTIFGTAAADTIVAADSTSPPRVLVPWGFVNLTDSISGGPDLVIDGAGGDDLIQIEDASTFLAAFDITLRGGEGNDTLIDGIGGETLQGNAGDDILDGRGGANTLDGGAGTDTILVSGTAASETITTTHAGAAFTIAGGLSAGTNTLTSMEQVRVEAGDGSDRIELNIDAAGGLNYEVLGGNPIGSPGDVLVVNSAALKIFTPGPENDSGSVDVFTAVPTKVSFDEIEELQLGGGGPGLLLGTNGDDDITIIARDDSTHAGADGIQDFTTSVNEGLDVLWLNTPVFLVDALAGDDDIVVREPAPNGAVWNVQLFIAGGTPAAITGDQGDVLEVETPGTQTVVYTPNPAAIVVPALPAGLVLTPQTGGIDTALVDDTTNTSVIAVAPFVLTLLGVTVFSSSPGGVEQIVYQGLAGGDTLTMNGTAGDDTFVVNPTGEGAGSHRSGLSPTFDYTGATITTANGGTGGFDVQQVVGSEDVDTVTSNATTVSFAGAGSTTIGATINRFELLTLGGNDIIDLDLNVAGLDKFVNAGAGNDTVNMLGSVDATIFGGIGDDTLIGSPVADYIYGDDPLVNGGGNDILIGAGGNDVLYGAEGNDTFGNLSATPNGVADDGGNDQFFGGPGSDLFVWEPGDGSDLMEGGAGEGDELRFIGNAGNNRVEVFGGGGSFVNPAFNMPGDAERAVVALNSTAFLTATVFIDTADIEAIHFDLLGGTDEAIINNQVPNGSTAGSFLQSGTDLASTHVQSVIVDAGSLDGVVDRVEVHGRLVADDLNIRSLATNFVLGPVSVAGFAYSVEVNQSVGGVGGDLMIVRGQTGDDSIKAQDGTEVRINIRLDGDEGNDSLSADAVLNGGAGDDFLEGGSGDDTINGGDGHDTMIGLGGADTFDGGAGFDTILVLGTPDNDAISINQTAATTLVHTVNGDTQIDTLVTIAGVRTVEAVRVQADAGDDTIQATWLDALGVDAVVNSLRIDIVGGDNFVRDRLGIVDSGTGDLVLYRKGELDSTGTVTIGPANAEPLELTFQQTELIQPIAGAGGQVEVFKHDPFEFNDFQIISTHLGADLTINLDPTIDPGTDPIFGLPADQDFYRVEALASGTLDFQVFFNQIVTVPSGRPGLPGNGDLSIEVRDAAGNIIVGFGVNDATSNERVRIPAVQGQLYFLRVFGATGAAINNYTATIINTPALVPYDIELDDNLGFGDFVAGNGTLFTSTPRPGTSGLSPINGYYVGKEITFTSGALDGQTATVTAYTFAAGVGTFTVGPGFVGVPVAGDDFQVDAVDTGRSQLDDVTRDNTPTIFLRLDDAFFLNDLPGNPAPDTPPDEIIPILFRSGPFLGLPGYAIAIFDEGPGTVGATPPQTPLGFAFNVGDLNSDGDTTDPGEGFVPGVYKFTTPLLTDGSHFLSARVQMIDPAIPQQTGFGERSVSLEIVVDTVPPQVSFGQPGVVGDGLIPDSDVGVLPNQETIIDLVTSDVTPTFFGRAEANAIVRLFVDHPTLGTPGVFDPADLFIGQDTAIPLDGTNQEPHGYWEIGSILNFNNPIFPLDGLRTVFITAEDLAGNVNASGDAFGVDADETLIIFVDTQGPRITEVEITDFPNYDLFNPKGPEANLQGPTPLVTQISIHFTDLPLRLDLPDPAPPLDFLYPALKPDTIITDHFQLFGDQVGRIAIVDPLVLQQTLVPVPGQPGVFLATATVILTFFSPLPDDRYTLIVTDDVRDPVGNRLDGETNAAEPQENPRFPSGDGIPGGDFVARFTVDSRPELGVYAGIRVYVDLNGNFVFDPEGQDNDAVNRDIVFRFGSTSDALFAGKFVSPGIPLVPQPPNPAAVGGATNRYFDQIAAYGNILGVFSWVFDFDSDGVADFIRVQPAGFQINGVPVAGNFDGNFANGDEVGLFDGLRWWRDTNHDFRIDNLDLPPINSQIAGFPQVGDIDGDALDDFVTFSGVDNTFYIDFAFDGLGVGVVAVIPFTDDGGGLGFPGVSERPAVADMNQDGVDDLGVWVPGNLGQTPTEISEWYFLVSQVRVRTGTSIPEPTATHIPGTAVPLPPVPVEPGGLVPARNTLWAFPPHTGLNGNPHFQPVPFGTSLFAVFGDEPAFPIVGNFDPPVGGGAGTDDTTGTLDSNNVVVAAAGAGAEPRVRVYDRVSGELVMDILAYNPDFRGGVQVATADVNGDGTVDIITAPGAGGGPHIRVFDGVTGNVLQEFFAYDPAFTGGVLIAAGDIDGDGQAEIITGPGAGGGPHVRIFDGSGAVLGEYFAYNPAFGGGVNVAVGDINGDGTLDVITGAGAGGGPHVRVFSGVTSDEIMGFFAYNPAFGGGVYVAAGDVDGDGRDDVITGAGAGGGPHVRMFSGEDGAELGGFFAYDAAFGSGVRVASGDFDGDGRADILTGPGAGGGPHVKAFDGSFTGGVFVAAPNLGGGQALRAATAGGGAALTQSQLDQFVAAVFDTSRVRVRVANLPGTTLGLAYSDLVLIDSDAAGHGWFVDSTPDTSDDLAADRIDLLSALAHEIGHVLGLEDTDDGSLMDGELSVGVRASLEAIDAVFAGL